MPAESSHTRRTSRRVTADEELDVRRARGEVSLQGKYKTPELTYLEDLLRGMSKVQLSLSIIYCILEMIVDSNSNATRNYRAVHAVSFLRAGRKYYHLIYHPSSPWLPLHMPQWQPLNGTGNQVCLLPLLAFQLEV